MDGPLVLSTTKKLDIFEGFHNSKPGKISTNIAEIFALHYVTLKETAQILI